jgi:hypothetical protein
MRRLMAAGAPPVNDGGNESEDDQSGSKTEGTPDTSVATPAYGGPDSVPGSPHELADVEDSPEAIAAGIAAGEPSPHGTHTNTTSQGGSTSDGGEAQRAPQGEDAGPSAVPAINPVLI